MAYVLFSPFKPQFEDSNGNPLVNGKVEFYLWNTSTATPYYTSSAGAGGVTSLTLNSLGKPDDQIFLDTSITGGYKIVTKDAAGVTIDSNLGPYYAIDTTSRSNADRIESVAALIAGDWTGYNEITTVSYYAGWAATAAGPKGGAKWHRTGATGTPSTTSLSTGVAYDATGAQFKLSVDNIYNVFMFGATGDGATNDSTAIQSAIDFAVAHQLVSLLSVPSGSEIVGGATLLFPPTASGYYIGTQINVKKSKITFKGPARLIIASGITGFAFDFSGSSDKGWVIFEELDFSAGAIAIDVGDNAQGMPFAAYNCKFVNQTSSGIKIGQFGYWNTIRDCLFTSCNYGVWHQGSSSDGLIIDHCAFIYNSNYDIYIQNTNVFFITNNDFVGNLKTPVSSRVSLYIDVGTSSDVGGYSTINGNKFGQEGRTDGNCIVFTGSGAGAIRATTIRENLLHFDSNAVTTVHAIKVAGIQAHGLTIEDNSLTYCQLIDYSTSTTNTLNGENSIGENTVISGGSWAQIVRGNYVMKDHIEPQAWDKYNILAWSRYVNSGGDFTYTNATPTYMASTDENGIANNATAVTATSASNTIRINSLNTNNQQRFYTFTLWCKLAAEASITLNINRGSDYAINRSINVGTSWQRICVEFYQTYLATGNPYVVDITIANAATITLGGVCCVPGRDVGDLRKTSQTTERYGLGIFSSASPSDVIYWPAGTVAKNSAPAAGQPMGWVCTVAGSPGTWRSEGNLP